jgi:hypothetical protein
MLCLKQGIRELHIGEKCRSAGILTTFGLDLLLTADYHPKFSPQITTNMYLCLTMLKLSTTAAALVAGSVNNALILKCDEHLAMRLSQTRTLLKCDMVNFLRPLPDLQHFQHAVVLIKRCYRSH